jgi:hypothetical protein
MNNSNLFNKFYVLFAVFLLLISDIYAQSLDWAALGSYNAGFGTNGEVNAIAYNNGNIIVAGIFSSAAGINVQNIALWNGTAWQPLGQGLNDTVYALAVYNGYLYAGGKFTQAGGTPASHIARWTGTLWEAVGVGVDDEVDAMTVYNSRLIMGGKFSSFGANICAYDGNNWYQLGTGTDDDVYALTVYSGNLIAGGNFEHAGGFPASKIAKWDGSVWNSLSGNTNEKIYALGLYNNSILVAGGKFTTIGGVSANYVAQWNGSAWSAFGGGVDDAVYAITTYRGGLVIGGQFHFAGSNLYADRIAKWDGFSWSRMITGMNSDVNALFVKDTSLYAAGRFITAGGRIVNRVSVWGTQPTSSISGEVRFSDNNQPVPSGNVRAYRMDLNSRELILEDSGRVINGFYVIPRVRRDSLFIMSFPDDELQDYVPTYHPSTIDWASAVRVYAVTNLSNVNVYVFRIAPGPQNSNMTAVGGHVYLNYTPPFNNPVLPLPFKSNSIVYVKSGSDFKKFGISTELETYSIPSVSPGNYDVYVNRIGYTSASRNIVVGTVNIDTLNFTLDTTSLIGIKNISSGVPKNFALKQNYPNPFNPVTKIKFDLAKSGFVGLSIFNVLGQEVQILVNDELKAGEYEVTFDALRLASGVYFYRLNTDDFSETRKMVLVK